MFCGRSFDKKINTLHERALRIAYNDYTSSFNALLDKDSSVTIQIFEINNKLSRHSFVIWYKNLLPDIKLGLILPSQKLKMDQ